MLSVAVIASLMTAGCAPDEAPPPEDEAPPEEGELPPPELIPEIYEALGRVTAQTGKTLLTLLVYAEPATEGFSIFVGEITPSGEFQEREFIVSGEFEKLPDIRPTAEPYEFNFRILERNFEAAMKVDPTAPSGALFWFRDTTTQELTSLAIIGYRGFPWIPVIVASAAIIMVLHAIEKCVPLSITISIETEFLERHLTVQVHEKA